MTCAKTKLGNRLFVSQEHIPSCDEVSLSEILQSTWVEIGKVTSLPEFGSETNFLERNFMAGGFSNRVKGYSSGVTTEIMVGPDSSDPGQVELLIAGDPLYKFNRAFKLENDAGRQVAYGVISGPTSNGGAGDEFDEYTFNITMNNETYMAQDLSHIQGSWFNWFFPRA